LRDLRYFNNNNEEVNKTKILKKDKVRKIKVVIDYKNNAFYGLFSGCKCIKKIKFLKFNRPNIVNMNLMFFGCSELEELALSKFRTDKVTKMFKMFGCCKKLKKLDLSKFNTAKVKEMNNMFEECSALEEINLSNLKSKINSNINYLIGHNYFSKLKEKISLKEIP